MTTLNVGSVRSRLGGAPRELRPLVLAAVDRELRRSLPCTAADRSGPN